ncbi:hypothetical protein PABG_11023 [Paracoccidioides brasiliensis Pb03]|nr:hypothetical protein PABG_11023 [Paracoccidioides brasiliensis Pb03]
MALAFHVSNFNTWKPWTPRHPKSFSPRKCPNSCTPESRKPPPPSPSVALRCDVSLNTMLPPKHGLPLKPPAEVCVPISGSIQLCAPLSSPSQPREMSRPSLSLGNPQHGLFEDALASCMPDSAPAIWGDNNVWPVSCSASHKVGETQRERGEGRKGCRDKLWQWLLKDDTQLMGMMEERRPWLEIERCFPERMESALRQRVSTLQKHKRGMRTAEPARVTVASAASED